MTVNELMRRLDELTEAERDRYLRPFVTNVLCATSQQTLLAFQAEWDRGRPYAEFVKAQAKILRECLKYEMSAFGTAVRQTLNLPPLTGETEIAS